jgi:hypothetical protein
MNDVVIGLSAVVMGLRNGEVAVLSARADHDNLPSLPSGPFDPSGHRTFELALRAFVTAQTGFHLGFVEQLYTFGDAGREAPRADVGAGAARVISVGYLALTPSAEDHEVPGTRWSDWSVFFPWEDWRGGRPRVIDTLIAPALRDWADSAATPAEQQSRLSRARRLFALDDDRWNEERVLERYEMLYDADLVPEALRDHADLGDVVAPPTVVGLESLGQPMVSDHRRILATGLGRLRGKLKYRPVVFDLMPPRFTLSDLQRTVEAVSGVLLHKQNFRRSVERSGFVEPLGQYRDDTGGRPAELFGFNRDAVSPAAAQGLSLPLRR